jgi:hypothetical protein
MDNRLKNGVFESFVLLLAGHEVSILYIPLELTSGVLTGQKMHICERLAKGENPKLKTSINCENKHFLFWHYILSFR